ncbi:MAG: histidine--tRNA ligase [bacterium]|nr:histidine--tRNA ligase [bacterium]
MLKVPSPLTPLPGTGEGNSIMSNTLPQILKGFRDYLPKEQITRKNVLAKISETFESFGFLPMDTPALEYYELLGGKYGDEGEQLMYKFQDQGERMVALRYDLTVPLARVMASNQDLAKPFKRYQIALAWRADKPQKGRYREFMQCDVDVIGSSSINADAETIAAMDAAYKSLGLDDVVLKFNNREIVDQALDKLQMSDEKKVLFMRTMDKLDKVGEGKVLEFLKNVGFNSEILRTYSKVMDELAQEYIQQMQGLLKAMGIERAEFDKYLVRGMDYYTGVVFEFFLPKKLDFGSIGGGGRYDKLIGNITGKDTPAVGGSIGLDRMLTAMEELGLVESQPSAQVLVMNLDEKLIVDYLKIVNNLRNAGIATDFYYDVTKIDKQFKYAESLNIPLAVIVGPDEIKNKQANIKILSKKEQKTVDLDDLLKEVKGSLT